jgi:hypothetical protein
MADGATAHPHDLDGVLGIRGKPPFAHESLGREQAGSAGASLPVGPMGA